MSLLLSCSSPNHSSGDDNQGQDTVEVEMNMDDISDSSLVTCPNCAYQKKEKLPSEYCLLALDCDSCGETMHPADGDCCVFCTHGTHNCPSMQE
jgi:hypothetical protein